MRQLAVDIQVPSLRAAGVAPDRLRELAPKMARGPIASGSPANNPRRATVGDIIELYARAP